MNQLHIAIEALAGPGPASNKQTCWGENAAFTERGVLVEPFFSDTDTGEQQYHRVINVAACQDHIILITIVGIMCFITPKPQTSCNFMDEQSRKLTNVTHENILEGSARLWVSEWVDTYW